MPSLVPSSSSAFFFCCRSEGEEAPKGVKLIEPPKSRARAASSFADDDDDDDDFSWKVSLEEIDGLEWRGRADFFVKATYAGRSMYSETLTFDDYRPGPLALGRPYVFRNSPRAPLSVALFDGAAQLAALTLDLDQLRDTDVWLDLPGTTARVRVAVASVHVDDDDAQVSCMDLPETDSPACALS
mmetsp:Transcript_21906/g.67432  ORF Transcript_21906/g.67432 Transcript_21906/m.67432 type:complete len:185 (-) Transcript_21906:238-792(-)